MSLVNLVKYMSAEVCAALIGAGLIASTLTVSNATNTTPIQITTTTPHNILTDAVVLLAGVLGNTAANDYWNVTVIDPQNFTLNGSVGNGAYTSGGTAQTALIGGKILLGRQWVRQNQARPRIVFIPVGGDGLPRDQYSSANVGDNTAGTDVTAAQQAAIQAPGVATMRNVFEVQCWGGAPTPNPDADFTYTEALRDTVIVVADKLARGNYTLKPGQWVDQLPQSTTDLKLGHLFVFQLTIDAPVAGPPAAIATEPSIQASVYYQPSDTTQSPELAATITVT